MRMITKSARPLEPWNLRAFVDGLGSVVVLTFTPRSITEGTAGVAVLAILRLAAVIARVSKPTEEPNTRPVS